MTVRPGEVVLVRIEFQQSRGGKIRPAVVLLGAGDDDFVAAPVTSQPRKTDFGVALEYWRESGLNVRLDGSHPQTDCACEGGRRPPVGHSRWN